MKLDIYQIDAFTSEIFKGNPAMVVPLDNWIKDDLMQSIAAENNLSETAFYVLSDDKFDIRWFTPSLEVDLCGHATLATAFVIFLREEAKGNQITFNSKSGVLKVDKTKDGYVLDFPITIPIAEKSPSWLSYIGGSPLEYYVCGEDSLLIYETQDEIQNLKPNFNALKEVPVRGVICSSKSAKYDFVSRFFAPAAGINEDPVTGSAHTKLAPYWADILKKDKLFAKQISKRGGELMCHLIGERVKLTGKAKLFLIGEIYV
jgi:predicted PhzF superfamily epimerase YddE/YHI9